MTSRRFLSCCVLLVVLVCCIGATRRVGQTQTGKFVITDWANRVVANGGAMPSQATIACMETLRASLVALNVTNKIYSLCIFVPDSVIAAATPLIIHKGYPMWTNNFVGGDLNTYGLKGDGTTKAMDTGVKAKIGEAVNANTRTRGLTVLVTESDSNNASAGVMGQRDEGGTVLELLLVSAAGITEWYPARNTVSDFIVTNDFTRVGYISGNVTTNDGTATTNMNLFFASPGEAHKLIATRVPTQNPLSVTTTEETIACFAYRYAATNAGFIAMRMSMAMVHDGLTQTESSNIWWAVKTCRECLGGGDGDPVHDFNRKVVAAGGANISATTSNALRTFHSGVDADGLLYFINAANCYVPDNLTAARTPFLYQAGNQIWTNVSFAASNLTVNGLTGDGSTKFLGTGLKPSTLTYGGFSDTSAGLSVLIFNVGTDANALNIGSTGTTANGTFAVGNQVGFLVFYCWIFTTVNTDFVIRTAPNAGWEGYLSGNRLANNVIRLDAVTNGVHNVFTNATGATASNNNTMTNAFAHAVANGLNAAANFSDQTVSFIALHPGFTQTQSSNLWNRVKDMRNAFGGGVPP